MLCLYTTRPLISVKASAQDDQHNGDNNYSNDHGNVTEKSHSAGWEQCGLKRVSKRLKFWLFRHSEALVSPEWTHRDNNRVSESHEAQSMQIYSMSWSCIYLGRSIHRSVAILRCVSIFKPSKLHLSSKLSMHTCNSDSVAAGKSTGAFEHQAQLLRNCHLTLSFWRKLPTSTENTIHFCGWPTLTQSLLFSCEIYEPCTHQC